MRLDATPFTLLLALLTLSPLTLAARPKDAILLSEVSSRSPPPPSSTLFTPFPSH
jgi:hypothetical protein